MEHDESKAKGGYARAEALTPEERKKIARTAAMARWDANIPQATHEGSFQIGDTTISAAVLANGKRLLTQGTFLRALGRSRTPKAGTGVLTTVDGIPFFLQADALKPFISEELLASTTPIFFLDKMGKRSVGYDAELLPKVAEVYLKLRDDCQSKKKKIPHSFEHIVVACDILMRGLARVGIVALVDEATGFQSDRARDALAKILEQFVAKELRKWVSTFDPDFYKEMFRLRGLPYNGQVRRPAYIGHLTNDLVYARLAPGVLRKLKEKNPVTENGRRKNKHHQWLTEDVGVPELKAHLSNVVTLMRATEDRDWPSFYRLLERALPKHPDVEMPLMDWAESKAESEKEDEAES